MSIFTRAVAAATEAAVVERTITRTRAGRALARRFVAGDSLEAGSRVAAELNRQGLSVSLDHLGEGVTDREGAERATDEYIETLARIPADGLRANISVKLTQLGLSIDAGIAAKAVDRLAMAAAEASATVTIDMEDSSYTQDTIDIYAEAQKRHGNLGVCLQAYLHRTPEDLERLIPLGGHIRLCKGAYVEPAQIAFQSSDDVDAAFARLLIVLMQAPEVRPAVATHDPRLISLTLDLAADRGEKFEFQMLYGVRQNEQLRLAALGEDVRVYVPFGSAWYPYLTRRLGERPANMWFFLRALVGH
ncbi:MAG TPA: proline dehydrogenase family protein [Acidimicrobiia bacterium]|nr:proline dehydrogenase family protein [Acidimicrobiia bacterium]